MTDRKTDDSPNGGAKESPASTITPDEVDEAVERAAEEESEHFRITEGQRKALSSSG